MGGTMVCIETFARELQAQLGTNVSTTEFQKQYPSSQLSRMAAVRQGNQLWYGPALEKARQVIENKNLQQ